MAHGLWCICKRCIPPVGFKSRSGKSDQAKQQSAARKARQQQRGSGKFGGTNTHGDSRKGGGQNGTGRLR